MSKSLLDLMPAEEAKKAIERGERRMAANRAKKGLGVTPEIFLVSEMGYYFDWEAIMAIRRGYTVVPKTDEDLDEDKRSGRKPEWTSMYKREVFTLEEAQVLLEGARKVWYSKLVEQSQASIVGHSFKSSAKSYDGAIKQFTDRAEVAE